VIVPSIDVMGGETVQLIGGREHALSAGEPAPLAQRFALAGEVAIIDLDAALGTGSNAAIIEPLLRIADCRIGGGIRDVATAIRWLDAGASKVILGTAAVPDVLRELPRERIIAALDAEHGEVVVDGWRTRTGETILERMRRLSGLVGGFLITFVEREGRLGGTQLDAVPELVRVARACGAAVTVAGGVSTAAEIATLDAMGADAQVGMAIYTGRLDLADAIAAPLRSDRPDGLWPTVVVDEIGVALGLAYSSAESLREAVRQRRGIYHSRSRGLWIKGESSGDSQDLLRVDLDCDRDAFRFTVRQHGRGFCHNGTSTCFGDAHGITGLESRLQQTTAVSSHSYTARLLGDPALLRAKLIEEAAELADAVTSADATHEASDLFYFAMVAMRRRGVSLAAVARELDARSRRIIRRRGDAKPDPTRSAP
jgi:phosphoribosyl-AMP cyclohydrolase / phosphoribosyl-ATP pyrophosphohydrolase